jgi:hypothetical protein
MNQQTQDKFKPYREAMAADDAWQVALEAKFGNAAGTMRYKREMRSNA